MAFSGNVSSMGLDQVIGFLANNGLEGVLRVTGSETCFELFFHQGRILFPHTQRRSSESGRLDRSALDAIRERADLLKKTPEVLDQEAIRRVRTEQKRQAEREAAYKRAAKTDDRKRGRGSVSSRTGVISRSALEEMLSSSSKGPKTPSPSKSKSGQISRVDLSQILERGKASRGELASEQIHELFLWTKARFEFKPGHVPSAVVRDVVRGHGLAFDPTSLLMEVARRADERQRSWPVGGARGNYEDRPRSGTRVVARPSAGGAGKSANERVLEGDLEGVGLAAVLQALRENRHTGTLSVAGEERTERLYFQEGDAYVLRSEGREGRDFVHFFLGDAGAEAVKGLATGIWTRTGTQVNEADLSQADQAKIREAFQEVLFWEGAEFSFRRDDLPGEFYVPPVHTTKVAVQTDRFLMEAIQLMTKWDAIRRVVGHAETVFQFCDPTAKMRAVQAHDADVLTLVDGRHTFEDILRISSQPRLLVGRLLADLIEAGDVLKL